MFRYYPIKVTRNAPRFDILIGKKVGFMLKNLTLKLKLAVDPE